MFRGRCSVFFGVELGNVVMRLAARYRSGLYGHATKSMLGNGRQATGEETGSSRRAEHESAGVLASRICALRSGDARDCLVLITGCGAGWLQEDGGDVGGWPASGLPTARCLVLRVTASLPVKEGKGTKMLRTGRRRGSGSGHVRSFGT